jgi:hypothetical protein
METSVMLRRLALTALLALAPSLASAQLAFIAPTAPTSDNGDRIANTAWVNNFVDAGLPLSSGKIFIGSAGNLATQQTRSGDCTPSVSGVATCTKTNGVAFAPSATTDATNAANILSGALPPARLPAGQLPGPATNDNVSAGNVGEFVAGQLLRASATSLTTETPKTITSISLTAGDWDVSAIPGLTGTSSTISNSVFSISTTNNVIGTQGTFIAPGVL